MFQVPVYFIYLVALYPIYRRITMFISSQLHSYGGQGWMYCIYGGTYFRLTVRFSYEV